MRKPTYLADEVWRGLPVQDFRARFFVEAYVEKLRMHTPHFYQARLMNIFSTCAEMMIYVDEQISNDKNSAYVISAMKEIDDCWDTDPVAQDLLSDVVGLRAAISKRVQNGELGAGTLGRLRVFCRAILSRHESYASALLEALEEAVVGPAELTQRDRITAQIDQLTGLYITHLLGRGYSPTYLFNRADMFCYEKNYSGRSFPDQFRLITERLQSHKISFDVYFGISTNRPRIFSDVKDDPDFSFLAKIPDEIQGTNREKLEKNIEINLVAKAAIEATDHVSAALRTKERLDRFLDAATALELKTNIQVSAHCVVIYQTQNFTYKQTLNVDMLLAFMSSEVGSSFSDAPTSIRQMLRGLNNSATDQLERSLRYLRLARYSVSLEQKLLNLWIALESLFGEFEGGILNGILEYLPQLYATTGLARRVAYLRNLLASNDIAMTDLVRSVLSVDSDNFDKTTTDQQVFALLKNEKSAIDLFNNLGDKEHLKFKLMKIFLEFKDNKAIKNRLEKSEGDVARQLRRIYFLRNKIAHAGHYKGVRPQLVTHLLDYIAVAYRAISNASSRAKEGSTYSIGELLTASRMGVDVVVDRANSKEQISTLDQIIAIPLI